MYIVIFLHFSSFHKKTNRVSKSTQCKWIFFITFLLSTDKQNIKIEKRMVIYHTFHVIWRENAEVNYRLTDN